MYYAEQQSPFLEKNVQKKNILKRTALWYAWVRGIYSNSSAKETSPLQVKTVESLRARWCTEQSFVAKLTSSLQPSLTSI